MVEFKQKTPRTGLDTSILRVYIEIFESIKTMYKKEKLLEINLEVFN